MTFVRMERGTIRLFHNMYPFQFGDFERSFYCEVYGYLDVLQVRGTVTSEILNERFFDEY